MASPENILLYLAPPHEAAVREVFRQLADRGFPTQHQTPHITITFAPTMQPHVVDRAAELLPGLVPADFHRAGTVVFGTKRKQTVTWLLETTDELEQAARELSDLNPDGRGNRWIPHLTVGLRLPRDIVPDYLRALDDIEAPKTLQAITAGYWRPAEQNLRVLAGEPRNLN
ncbi:2'-5' RNA ligase family protein [Staphylococcus chromogenes]|nr:2'-5' RNA ligase family protein [Staphylococcus chromogenes]